MQPLLLLILLILLFRFWPLVTIGILVTVIVLNVFGGLIGTGILVLGLCVMDAMLKNADSRARKRLEAQKLGNALPAYSIKK